MKQASTDYDAIVVGSGPNGLAAAITLRQAGLSVLLLEGKDSVGGGMRTAELTLPGFHHDICSAIHPMATLSPFLKSLPLQDYGLTLIHPPVAAAHPFDNGHAAALLHSLPETARSLGADEQTWLQLIQPVVNDWPYIVNDVLGPLGIPRHPLRMARFGLTALRSAAAVARRFRTEEARGLWAGLAAHSLLPLSYRSSAAIGLVLSAAAHISGWPVVKGGSQSLANALAAYFRASGGEIRTGFYVQDLGQLPSARAVLLDVSPRQLLQIGGNRFSSFYQSQLKKYRYGPGIFKVDWALDGPIPFTAAACREAGTVHIGNAYTEIAAGELGNWQGKTSRQPFVLLAQQSLFDDTRAPQGQHTAWAYCHVPNGSNTDMREVIEQQVERFAPGFRKRIIARHVMNAAQMEAYNPNYIGGDINGGAIDLRQLFTRPALRPSPYRTSAAGVYICSASTPPGGGVHGMCGYHAAMRAIRDIFSGR
ncbi:phytoene desaturase family protein [Chitinophaga vietnamensis]|uniref:phytoene desaturase family protein n=1 Tax=Chitinophaga vietnamensis TaxID=2593957 RepID=UPI00117777E4|nr:NAD(P)/FAD-dependent oxidoreductase [Chitinophaga vietnamensis]